MAARPALRSRSPVPPHSPVPGVACGSASSPPGTDSDPSSLSGACKAQTATPLLLQALLTFFKDPFKVTSSSSAGCVVAPWVGGTVQRPGLGPHLALTL